MRPAPSGLMRLWGSGIGAMTLPHAIYISPVLLRGDPALLARLVQHELVHVRQWRELGVVRFLSRYLREYVSARIKGLDHVAAYHSISLEREARALAST